MADGIVILRAEDKDTPIIEGILSGVLTWLESIGKPIWDREHISWASLSKDFRPSDFYIAYMDGEPVGCLAVVDYDPTYWPDIEKGVSLFIHKFAVVRAAAGKGVSIALLDYAKNECKRRGISTLRLETFAGVPKVRAIYERNGFNFLYERVMFGKYPTAFYKCEIELDR